MISYKKELKRETAVFRMVGITTFSRYLLVVVLLALGTVSYTSPAKAAAGDGGYEGVMAPPPAPDDASADTTAAAAPDDAQDPSPDARKGQTQQFSQAPGSAPSHDLKVLSMVHGLKDGNGAIAGLKGPDVNFSTTTSKFVDGKPLMEYTVQKNIEHVMASINDKNISDEQRAINAKNGYKNLSMVADGLRSKQGTPDRIYKQMGLSDKYISDERAGDAAALAHVDAALASLKPYQ